MKEAFKVINFRPATLVLIEKCNTILDRYAAAGYDMTLRQLYYQLVSANEIPNSQKEYDKLGSVVNDARLAGLIDWDYIVDRTRNVRSVSHWDDPGDIINSAAKSYRIDKWADQPYRPEVWIEKDALAGVFERVCTDLDVPFFSCRGYTSQSEMYAASQRMNQYAEAGQQPYIFHFGDHDPSGIDMSRDIQGRLQLFGVDLDFDRLALNMDQVEEYDPPPNPAKLKDSRCRGYIREYGMNSWELDALEPDVLASLVRSAIEGIIDDEKWDVARQLEREQRLSLAKVSHHYEKIADYVKKL